MCVCARVLAFGVSAQLLACLSLLALCPCLCLGGNAGDDERAGAFAADEAAAGRCARLVQIWRRCTRDGKHSAGEPDTHTHTQRNTHTHTAHTHTHKHKHTHTHTAVLPPGTSAQPHLVPRCFVGFSFALVVMARAQRRRCCRPSLTVWRTAASPFRSSSTRSASHSPGSISCRT